MKVPARLSTLHRWIFGLFLLGCQFFSIQAFPLVSPTASSIQTNVPSSLQPLAAGAAVSMIWDGPAWQHLRNDDDDSSITGTARAVVGSTEEHARVVALEVLDSENRDATTTTQLTDGTVVYKDSMATIPSSRQQALSDMQAAATLLQAIPIHTVWPRAEAVGGSTTSHHVEEPTVVVVGSSTDTTAAPMLAALGAKVTVVGSKDTTPNEKVQFLTNKNDTPFCDVIGSFDALIDTLTDPSLTIRERLAAEHGCHSVVSTVSAAAVTVQKHGLLKGPKRVKQEIAEERQQHAFYRPTAGLGDLVSRLLSTDYVTKDTKVEQRQGWSWSGYWESTLWPTDTAGGMFGYPATNEYDDDEEDDDDEVYDDDDEDNTATSLVDRLLQEQREQQAEMDLEARSSSTGSKQAPAPSSRVTPVASRQDLQDHVVSPQSTSVVLFTAPFCRTCRYLKPLYNRLAGQHASAARDDNDDVNFYIVPDAASPDGKDLSRLLNVDAVPAVVMFKHGRRWGQTISLSSIPDPHLTQALEWLRTDQDFDSAALEKLPRKKQRRR